MILTAQNIKKAYPKVEVLKDIHLSLAKGESIAICGRSGEGKTTLLHILGGLEKPDSGQVHLQGEKGFVFQSYNLLEDFTALENVLMPARIARQKTTREQGLKLLKLVDLEQRADFPAKLLSGGEKQRVALARALCNNPSLILADEPTGNLDRETGKKIGQLLFSLVKTQGASLILVTHDPELAKECDKRYELKSGSLTRV
jgi:lipoprotein-releasing system ATP-binding protein